MKNKVGRPISKIDRKKVGFSLEGLYVDKLNELVDISGNSKSTIVEKAISLYYESYFDVDKNVNKKSLEDKKNSFDRFRDLLSQ